MGDDYLSAIVQEPSEPATAAVIWMHGLGASGHDFEPIPPELGLPSDLPVRFVFPHAPRIPVTINMGLIMPAWYDIHSLDGRGQDEAGVRRSEQEIRKLVAREVERGIPTSRIVLAGFSQGGAMAIHTGLRLEEPLAGILMLSAFVPIADTLEAEIHDANRKTPIFQAHGLNDPMIAFPLAEEGRQLLEDLGLPVEWHSYPMAHEVCYPEIRHIGAWLARVLGADEDLVRDSAVDD